MTEEEWLEATDPTPKLEFLRGKASERKLRLFACSCPKVIWERLGDAHRRVIAIGERYADNAATLKEVEEARSLALRGSYQGLWLTVVADIAGAMLPVFNHEYLLWVDNHKWHCHLLNDIFGNPFRPVTFDPAWLTPTVTNLARAIYDDRQLPSGLFDNQRLGVLADALEDAGCGNADILSHLRGGGEHLRGCWVVDLVLGKK
jgi:hypothetical protein